MVKATYKYTGKGLLILADGTNITPGKMFTANKHDVPKGASDVLVLIASHNAETLEEDEDVELVDSLDDDLQEDIEEDKYTLVKLSDGKYNIKATSGKLINEKPLSKSNAEKMLKHLGA